MATDITKNEISDSTPAWIDINFPNEEEYIAVMDVIKFYLINCPCEKSSSRWTDISVWGKNNTVLLGKVKSKIGLEKGKNYDYGTSMPSMKKLFEKYEMHTDFTNIISDTVIFQKNGNVLESLFKHIRNAIAHSRWQVRDDIYYFEDGKFIDEYFCVTARIVLKKETLMELRDIIIAGPTSIEQEKINLKKKLEELLEKLRMTFEDKGFTRKEAVTTLGIGNAVWKQLYTEGKSSGAMEFKKHKWRMTRRKQNDDSELIQAS